MSPFDGIPVWIFMRLSLCPHLTWNTSCLSSSHTAAVFLAEYSYTVAHLLQFAVLRCSSKAGMIFFWEFVLALYVCIFNIQLLFLSEELLLLHSKRAFYSFSIFKSQCYYIPKFWGPGLCKTGLLASVILSSGSVEKDVSGQQPGKICSMHMLCRGKIHPDV